MLAIDGPLGGDKGEEDEGEGKGGGEGAAKAASSGDAGVGFTSSTPLFAPGVDGAGLGAEAGAVAAFADVDTEFAADPGARVSDFDAFGGNAEFGFADFE